MVEYPEPLKEEIQTYFEKKEELIKENNNKFVLIKGKKIISIFDSDIDALKEGYKLFKKGAFLVKRIVPTEPPLNFTTNMLGG